MLIARRDAGHIRLNPDLQKVRGLAFGVVELAVLHTGACAHALHVARRNAAGVAHAVFVRQLTAYHVADDFHVAVAVGAKTPASGHAVFIHDAQVAEAHVGCVVVARKREGMK